MYKDVAKPAWWPLPDWDSKQLTKVGAVKSVYCALQENCCTKLNKLGAYSPW